MKTGFVGNIKAMMRANGLRTLPLPKSRKRRRKIARQKDRAWRRNCEKMAMENHIVSIELYTDPDTGLPMQRAVLLNKLTDQSRVLVALAV